VAIDRRGRGASGDTLPYSIVHEFEDVAAVADAVAAVAGRGVDVVGHSYGGRCALGAALLASSIRRVVVYEGAPAPVDEWTNAAGERLLAELRRLVDAGRPDEAVRSFMRTIVGQTPAELAAFEASPVWDARVAAAPTILRELDAALHAPEASLDALARVSVPVLLIAGAESGPTFRAGIDALAARLPDARVVVLPGQRHAAHHGAAARFAAEVTAFLEA
jgi:pimeloyl-ACP methyl ester carboxylesterase